VNAAEQPSSALYVCYLGLDDPLVHSQVVAYIHGLARRGHRVHLLTFETGRLTRARRRRLRSDMAALGIAWHGTLYHKRPSLPATAWDVLRGAVLAAWLIRRHRLDIFHARSHMPAAMALIAAPLAPFALLFDIRGILGEEYVDAGIWRRGSLPFRLIKRVERLAIDRAGGAVVLTHRVRDVLFANDDDRVTVIPCCADLELVRSQEHLRKETRRRLGLEQRSVLIYVGKFTGWYLQREMVQFFARAREAAPDLHFLVLSQSDPALISEEFARFDVPDDARTITRVAPEQIGAYLAAADAAIAFIKPCYSKISSSPTKIGEYLAAGLMVVTGRGIGDVDALLEQYDCGVVLDSFEAEHLDVGATLLQQRMGDTARRERSLQAAQELSLTDVGVPRYAALYAQITSPVCAGTPRA
jgi:glycosyltransferase involved in cell wall biosynthesis